MRKGWEIKKLGEVCELITKGTTPTSVGFKFTNEGVNFIKVESLTESGKIIPEKVAFISDECHLSLRRSQLKENDILFSIAGALGRIGIVNDEILPANTNQALAIIRLKRDVGVSVNFLSKYFISEGTLKQIEKYKGGVAQQNLSLGQLNELKIPIPPFTDQHRIVSILDEAFEAIDQAKANTEKNLQNAKELFQSELNSIFTNKGEGWVEKKLGDVLQKTETINPLLQAETEFIYIDVSSVNKETLLIEDVNFIKGKDAPSRARKFIKTNDVIFATVRPTLKRIAIIPEEYNEQICSTGYFVLRASDMIDFRMLFYYLQTFYFQDKMEKLQKGASYPAVTDNEVRLQIINFPTDKKVQQSIVRQLDALSSETKKLDENYRKKLESLEELKKSILQKAFSGELTRQTRKIEMEQLDLVAEDQRIYQT